MGDFFDAGGLPALLDQIRDLLHLDAPTVQFGTLSDYLEGAKIWNEDVIRVRSNPVCSTGSLAVLRAIWLLMGAIKPAAAESRLLQHRGPAAVFANYPDLKAQTD
jgi:dihydroxy-acid dehydratase